MIHRREGIESWSAQNCLDWLEGENLDSSELAFWTYLARKAKRYPCEYIPPLTKTRGPCRVRRLLGCRIRTGNDTRGQPVPRLLQLYDGTSDVAVDVGPGSDGADAFVSAVLTKAHRSAFVVFANGGRVELRLIAQRWGQRLMEMGFTIDVLMGGGKLKALILKRDRHRWYLTDWESLTGLTTRAIASLGGRTKTDLGIQTLSAITVQRAAVSAQQLTIDWFGVGLSLTISSTAVKAASRSLPDQVCKFKPAPMLVAMCREGGAFRGGLVRGKRYRGPAWLVDINRAYTAALRFELPWRAVLGRCDVGAGERPGVFMCKVTGHAGLAPCYVSWWTGSCVETGWRGDAESTGFYALLPTVEIDGLRAIGYDVKPGWGMVYTRTFSLREYVGRILACCRHYGAGSVEARITKGLGNAVYGKFAASPTRRDLRLGVTRPGRDWLVFVDETGWPVEDLWEREVTKYQQSQHIDVATEITARVRGQMYAAQAETSAAGGEVVAMSTDALVVNIEPSELLAIHGTEFGRFKLADADPDGIVAGPNAYAVGEKIIVPDHPAPVREDVVSLFTSYVVEADTQISGAPRPGAPLSWRVRKRITMPVSEEMGPSLHHQPPVIGSPEAA